MCYFEANEQFKRDKYGVLIISARNRCVYPLWTCSFYVFVDRMVENEILNILRQRFEDCVLYESPDHNTKCKGLLDQYNEASANWFTKCTQLSSYSSLLFDWHYYIRTRMFLMYNIVLLFQTVIWVLMAMCVQHTWNRSTEWFGSAAMAQLVLAWRVLSNRILLFWLTENIEFCQNID